MFDVFCEDYCKIPINLYGSMKVDIKANLNDSRGSSTINPKINAKRNYDQL